MTLFEKQIAECCKSGRDRERRQTQVSSRYEQFRSRNLAIPYEHTVKDIIIVGST